MPRHSPEAGRPFDPRRHRARDRISRRSLQRILAELVKAGRLNLVNRGRLSRYLAPAQAEKEDYTPLSTSGAEVRREVRTPLTELI